MKYQNPEIPEGINVSAEHPLKSFAQLLVGFIGVVAVIMVILNLSVGVLVKFIPFSFEVEMTNHIPDLIVEPSPRQEALQQLADELVLYMDLPEDMVITVHYSDEDIVNAFATIGGHVFFYKGLIEQLQSEDELAMVMAHEIAHIKHRHPMVSLGKGITLMALASVVSGVSGSNAGDKLIDQSIELGSFKFSRDDESQSDLTAAHVINQRYQHILGAKELFSSFSDMEADAGVLKVPLLFSTHPHSENRWTDLHSQSSRYGWGVEGELTPLKDVFNVY